MEGRKPKPTAIKKLEGNQGKRKLNRKEPVPAKGIKYNKSAFCLFVQLMSKYCPNRVYFNP